MRVGVLFDLDGTLLDTAPDLGAACNHVLSLYGYPPISDDAAKALSSHGALGLLKHGFDKIFESLDPEVIRQQFLDYYTANICQRTDFYPGVRESLAYLKQQQIPWGIVTNKPEALSHALLAFFPEFEDCQVVIGGDTLPIQKPNPEPLYAACQTIQREPKNCLYIGDAERDIEAGNRAGMTTLLADWGYISDSDQPELWQASERCKKSTQLINKISTFVVNSTAKPAL